MRALLPILLVAAHAALAADIVPTFDIEPSCRAAGDASPAPGRDAESCRRDERDARSKLEQDWSKYRTADRARCVQLTMIGGKPSYVEVLTCLEMARDVEALPPAARPR
ncbi:MAG: hypothetical protein ACK4UO_09460 [Pseudolabrys sp.]